MPIISAFYGIVIFMYYTDRVQHHRPHIHVKYAEFTAGIAIDDGDILYGGLPGNKMKLVQAWIEIHRSELLEDWQLAVNGRPAFIIEPLK